jgi:hypothetical protein
MHHQRVQRPASSAAERWWRHRGRYGLSNGYCKVQSWTPTATAEAVVVLCFGAAGKARDTRFDAIFAAPVAPTSSGLSYLWANQPTAASYTPAAGYQYNSGGGTDTVTRNGVGSYTAAIPVIGILGGTVKVTGYGPGNTTCGVKNWTGSPTAYIDVVCYAPTGAPADSPFTLTWADKTSLMGTGPGSPRGYVWASDDTLSSYTPATTYSYNDAGELNTITRLSTGQYVVRFSELLSTAAGDTAGGDVQVTAVNSDARCDTSS